MLPPFNFDGYLPPGIHRCTIAEVVNRFGSGSAEREVEVSELLEFVDWANAAGIERIMINGSFVTSVEAPNDVDIVILPGADYPRTERRWHEQESLWPFLQVFVAVDVNDFIAWAEEDFGTDREQREKGVVEVVL